MVEAITNVWSEVMTWITTALGNVQSVFYTETGLTFLGTLAVIGVAIGIVFLIIGVIQNFLRLRS